MKCDVMRFRSLLICTGYFLILAFLVLGCQKASESETEPGLPDAAEEPESEQTESEEAEELVDPEEQLEEPDNLLIYNEDIVRRVMTAPDTAKAAELEDVSTEPGDVIDCDDLENDSSLRTFPYSLPEEYLFEDRSAVWDNITFEELPIFQAPMTPVLCHLKQAIIDKSSLDRPVEAFFLNDLGAANYDSFLVSLLLDQVIEARPNDDKPTNIDVDYVVEQISIFAARIEQRKNIDMYEWENNKGAAGAIIGIVSFLAGARFRRPVGGAVRWGANKVISKISFGRVNWSNVSNRWANTSLANGVQASTRVVPAIGTLSSAYVTGHTGYILGGGVAGLSMSKGEFAKLEDYNLLLDEFIEFDPEHPEFQGELTSEEKELLYKELLETLRQGIR